MLAAAALVLLSARSFAAEPLVGVYGENSMQRVLDFEAWLAWPVDVILCTVDYQKWENYRYADWLSQTVFGARGQRRLVYDVPIIITGATYPEAKAGAYDSHWQSLAQSIIANNQGDYEIVIRPSHEMNGEWFAWGVGGSRQALIPDSSRRGGASASYASQTRRPAPAFEGEPHADDRDQPKREAKHDAKPVAPSRRTHRLRSARRKGIQHTRMETKQVGRGNRGAVAGRWDVRVCRVRLAKVWPLFRRARLPEIGGGTNATGKDRIRAYVFLDLRAGAECL